MNKPLQKLELTNPRFHIFEGLSIQRIAAPLPRRILAYIIDLSIVTACLYLLLIFGGILLVPLTALLGSLVKENIGAQIFFVLFALLILIVIFGIYHGYFVYYEFKKGQTLGKRVFALQVISEKVKKLSLRQCVLRDALRYIDCLLIFPGLLSILLSKNHQRLGDLVCGTQVIFLPKKEKEEQFLYITPEQYHLYSEALEAAAVPGETAQNYLGFAYPYFISKTQRASAEKIEEILSDLKKVLPKAVNLKVDQESLMLFFAEHCHQQLKK
ncbi:MAG: RDD family protein [Deltaproteobacteria bacterium]|nr:RDD family protein [Deltaproteobacteria bacterium]